MPDAPDRQRRLLVRAKVAGAREYPWERQQVRDDAAPDEEVSGADRTQPKRSASDEPVEEQRRREKLRDDNGSHEARKNAGVDVARRSPERNRDDGHDRHCHRDPSGCPALLVADVCIHDGCAHGAVKSHSQTLLHESSAPRRPNRHVGYAATLSFRQTAQGAAAREAPLSQERVPSPALPKNLQLPLATFSQRTSLPHP